MSTFISMLRSMPLAFALCVTGTSPHVLAAPATSSMVPAAAYAVDLRDYLDSIHWYERALAGRPHLNDPYNREFFAAFSASMTPDRFYDQAMPVFERYIPPSEARTLGAMARKRPVSATDQQVALAAFAKIDSLARAALAKIWDGLIDDFSNTNIERSVAELRRSIADIGAHDEPDYVPRVNTVGLSYLDRINALTVTLYATQWHASKTREERCARTSPEAALAPAAILAPGGFAAAHQALDACQAALQTQDTSNESAFNDFRTQVETLKLADRSSMLEQMQQLSLKVHHRAQRLGRMHRQLLQDQRRLVALLEARREHVQLQNGDMVFDSDADVAQAGAIIDDIVTHAEAINDYLLQLREESELLRDMDLHDGFTAAERPAAVDGH